MSHEEYPVGQWKTLVRFFQDSEEHAKPWREYPAAFEEYLYACKYAEFYSVMATREYDFVLMFGDSQILGQFYHFTEAVSEANSHAYKIFEKEDHLKHMDDVATAIQALRQALS